MEAQALSDAGRALYAETNACCNNDQLDEVAKSIWRANCNGRVSDGEASYLIACIERRRSAGPRTEQVGAPTVGRLASRLQRRFTPRKQQRSPDRKASRDRRRMLGGLRWRTRMDVPVNALAGAW